MVIGFVVDVDGVVSFGVEIMGVDDFVIVMISGLVFCIEVIFDNGEFFLNIGVIGFGDIIFFFVFDGIVEGDDIVNVIDMVYLFDFEGDMVMDFDMVIYVGGGDDFVEFGEGNDMILGGVGNDIIKVEGGNDSIDGGMGNDSIEVGFGDDIIIGGEGDDIVNGYYGDDILDGGLGNDLICGFWGNDMFYFGGMGEGDDFIWGGWGDDCIIMEEGFGNDIIFGDIEDEVYGDMLDLIGVISDLIVDMISSIVGMGIVSDGISMVNYIDIEYIELGVGMDIIVLVDGFGSDCVIGFIILIDNGDGIYILGDMFDVSVLISDGGGIFVIYEDVIVLIDVDGNVVLIFSGGENLILVGVLVVDVLFNEVFMVMGFFVFLDGIVSGIGGDDLINYVFVDVDGDVIDGNDVCLSGFMGDDDFI